MCTYSMVMDRWDPIFPPFDPQPIPTIPAIPWAPPWVPGPVEPLVPAPNTLPFVPLPPPNMTWPEVIEKFRREAEAAKAHDIATGQPDCEDAEKAKLVDRVAELERRLAILEREVGLREAK